MFAFKKEKEIKSIDVCFWHSKYSVIKRETREVLKMYYHNDITIHMQLQSNECMTSKPITYE